VKDLVQFVETVAWPGALEDYLKGGGMTFLQSDDLAFSDFIGLIQRYHTYSAEKFASLPLLLAFSPARAIFNTFAPDDTFSYPQIKGGSSPLKGN